MTAALRRHWLMALLVTAGLMLRILAQVAYRPALFFIDTVKYLFGAYPESDPQGYRIALKVFLPVANLATVAAVQHLLGLAMGVAIYALVLRRGAPRWLAALAAAPVLLDGYELQMEQTIMPDVLFEALMVAGLVVLLWRPRPRLWQAGLGCLLLGATATMWEPGEILIVPALVFVVITAAGWRRIVSHAAVACVAFALPIAIFCYSNYEAPGIRQFSLAPQAGSTIYGRMAYAADCSTLKLPAYERQLCPPRQLALRLGPDGLVHLPGSPLKHYVPPPGMAHHDAVTGFSRAVLKQQPLRVIGSVLSDSIKLFEVHRVTSAGDKPISRWQFQGVFPTYSPYVTIDHGVLRFADYSPSGKVRPLGAGTRFTGIHPLVMTGIADFLRAYQLDGGYTPGPLLLVALLAGLAGSAFLLRRRRDMSGRDRDAARACCYILGSAVLLLLLSDTFEFSWRYQLPALVTLPPAGALGLTVIISYLRGRRRGRAGQVPAPVAAGPSGGTWPGGTLPPGRNGATPPAAGNGAGPQSAGEEPPVRSERN